MIRSGTRAAVVAVLLWSVGCTSEAPVPTGPRPSAPSGDRSGLRVEIAIDPGPSFPSTERRLRIALVPSTAVLAGRLVVLESTNPSVAGAVLSPDASFATVFLLAPGTTEIRARVDGVASNAVVLRVDSLPSSTSALVVEEFVLQTQHFPGDPPGTVWYMPQVRLREPTGRGSATLVGVSASMPTAPAVSLCSTHRTWGPGESAYAFGLDPYFHELEFAFGPFATVPTSGPVTLTLLVRNAQGVLGTLFLSKTMGPQDIRNTPPAVVTTHLSC
jgi:hypothetical protein